MRQPWTVARAQERRARPRMVARWRVRYRYQALSLSPWPTYSLIRSSDGQTPALRIGRQDRLSLGHADRRARQEVLGSHGGRQQLRHHSPRPDAAGLGQRRLDRQAMGRAFEALRPVAQARVPGHERRVRRLGRSAHHWQHRQCHSSTTNLTMMQLAHSLTHSRMRH